MIAKYIEINQNEIDEQRTISWNEVCLFKIFQLNVSHDSKRKSILQ